MNNMSNNVFYPTNVGGMCIKWVDNNFKPFEGRDTLLENIATMENHDDDVTINILSIINQEEINEGKDIEYNLKVTSKISIGSIIEDDIKWINEHNSSINHNDPHYINLDSLSIQYIELNANFNFIRIHYNFCQNCFGCSDARRMMVGACSSLFKAHNQSDDYVKYFPNVYFGQKVYW